MESVWLSLPSASFFSVPPNPNPLVVPAPRSSDIPTAQFTIPPSLYEELLSVKYPITIALVYAVTTVYLNQLNRSRKNAPWAFSKTRAFFYFVVAHNVFLAVYSAWTCIGMFVAAKHSVARLDATTSIPEVLDSLCKMHGPRGFGDAVSYNTTTSEWTTLSSSIKLGVKGVPDSTDVGRLWNEGLAFYGWLFYISKFYEVVDTFIILAKGKNTSFLQTYHHAGAMFCLWSGIRYMAAPIWMFVFVNSFIHTLMYTYYTLTALSVPVPTQLKRTLTGMQIAQMIWGSIYAGTHLFISYMEPVQTYTTVTYTPTSTVPVATVTATSKTALLPFLAKLGLRAAGNEGLAENVPADLSVQSPQIHKVKVTTYQPTQCVTNPGQAFAISLNLLYLAPLTWLFMQFFIAAYTRRGTKGVIGARRAGKEAAKGVERVESEGLAVS